MTGDTKGMVMIQEGAVRINGSCGDGTRGYEIDLEGFLEVKEWRFPGTNLKREKAAPRGDRTF